MVLSILVVVVMVHHRSKSAEAVHFSLARARASAVANDWENPIYSQAARNVAFDNPIYDRLDWLLNPA